MELELKDYFNIVWKRIWLIASVVVLACVAMGYYTYNFVTPVYSASTKLVINKSNDIAGQDILNLGTLNANIQLINTYKEIIRTPAILDKVIAEHPEFNLTTNALNSKINVFSPTESQVMTISVSDDSQEDAANIVNAVAEVFREQIPNIMSVDNVTILNKANVLNHPTPIAPNATMNLIVAFILSLVLSVGFVLVKEYFNDTIRTEKDIEKTLGVPMLVMVGKIKKKELKNKTQTTSSKVGETNYVGVNT